MLVRGMLRNRTIEEGDRGGSHQRLSWIMLINFQILVRKCAVFLGF